MHGVTTYLEGGGGGIDDAGVSGRLIYEDGRRCEYDVDSVDIIYT